MPVLKECRGHLGENWGRAGCRDHRGGSGTAPAWGTAGSRGCLSGIHQCSHKPVPSSEAAGQGKPQGWVWALLFHFQCSCPHTSRKAPAASRPPWAQDKEFFSSIFLLFFYQFEGSSLGKQHDNVNLDQAYDKSSSASSLRLHMLWQLGSRRSIQEVWLPQRCWESFYSSHGNSWNLEQSSPACLQAMQESPQPFVCLDLLWMLWSRGWAVTLCSGFATALSSLCETSGFSFPSHPWTLPKSVIHLFRWGSRRFYKHLILNVLFSVLLFCFFKWLLRSLNQFPPSINSCSPMLLLLHLSIQQVSIILCGKAGCSPRVRGSTSPPAASHPSRWLLRHWDREGPSAHPCRWLSAVLPGLPSSHPWNVTFPVSLFPDSFWLFGQDSSWLGWPWALISPSYLWSPPP